MRFELIEDDTVDRRKVTPERRTESTERRVTLRILEATEPIVTGQKSRPRRYLPDTLTIRFKNGKLREFRTSGPYVKADGTLGKRREDDWYEPDGSRWIYRNRPPAPAEIVEEVQRWA